MKKERLTRKELRFAREYCVDFNGTRAAIKAGFSQRSAHTTASDLLRKPKVKEAVDKIVAELDQETLVSMRYVILGLKEVAERCMQQKPVMEFDRTEKAMVQKTAMVEVEEDGKTFMREVGVWEFDSQGANRALELLGRHQAMFTERHEVTGKGGGPIRTETSHNLEHKLDNLAEEKLLEIVKENDRL